MTLQLALDGAEKGRTLDEAMGLARAARQYTDIIEVGTSFVLRDGLAAVKKFARAGFGVPILADVKIMDCTQGRWPSAQRPWPLSPAGWARCFYRQSGPASTM